MSFGEPAQADQYHQARAARVSQEYARRERLFGDFIVQASKAVCRSAHPRQGGSVRTGAALCHQGSTRRVRIKMRLRRADEVLRLIVDSYYRPDTE
jgi:hypothetical protein